jgi:hypothetical protein
MSLTDAAAWSYANDSSPNPTAMKGFALRLHPLLWSDRAPPCIFELIAHCDINSSDSASENILRDMIRIIRKIYSMDRYAKRCNGERLSGLLTTMLL